MLIDVIRIGALLIVTFAYALFDVFNGRNVPDFFVFATLTLGIILTFTYPLPEIGISALIALVITSLGYITYKIGVLGAGDTFEFLFISLVLPLQITPMLINVPQFLTPFILSVFIATGYATIIATPFYYIMKAREKKAGKISMEKRSIWSAAALITAYIILILALNYLSNNTLIISVVLLLVAIPSAVIILFKQEIYEAMVVMVYPSKLESGDMIATSMMSKKDFAYFKKRAKHFDRLANTRVIDETRNIKKKIPVYKNAIPLALFTFIGVVISLLIGNIVLLLIV